MAEEKEQLEMLPDSATPSPAPLPPATPITSPSLSSGIVSCSNGGNGKWSSSSSNTQQPPATLRYPPREVPPRFRQQEHKQLLKRGQPLPAGTLTLAQGQPTTPSPPHPSSASPTAHTFSDKPLHPEVSPQSGQVAQYENPHWGHLSTNHSATPATSNSSNGVWDQLIIDQSDTEAWPSISRAESHALAGCSLDTESTTDIKNMSMATGAGQQGHFPANHPSKTGTSHAMGLLSSQGGTSRSWISGPSTAPGGEGKSDNSGAPVVAKVWGSSNFNLNLNPNANPSAWPALGHEGTGAGGGSSGGSSLPPPNLCSLPDAPPNQGNMGGANGSTTVKGASGSSAWGGSMSTDPSAPHISPSTNVSLSSEPQNLNTDGPNHTKQEPRSPSHGLPIWSMANTSTSLLVKSTQGASQMNREEGSVWGNGDAKPSSSPSDSGWDSGGGWDQTAASGTTGWEQASSSSDWHRNSSGEAKGWESGGSPTQEQQLNPWTHAANASASEGSSDSLEGRPHRRDRSSKQKHPPLLPACDLDPRVLCNTGWGQTPVRQHTAWETEEAASSNHKNDIGTEAWGTSSNASSSGPLPPSGSANHNSGTTSRPDSGGKSEECNPNSAATPGWGTVESCHSQPKSGWGDPPSNKKPLSGSGNWGQAPPGGLAGSMQKTSQSWGSEEKSPTWDDPYSKAKLQGWVEGPKPSHGWGTRAGEDTGTGEWGEAGDVKKNGPSSSSWEGEGSSWKEAPCNWGKPATGVGRGWADTSCTSTPGQGWNNKSQELAASSGSVGSWGGPDSVKQSSTGWGGGNGGAVKQDHKGEPTGWEEPSPPSIRRKMEIDDGTSAWGDPSTYNKAVNLWDRNNPSMQGKPVSSNTTNPPNPNHHHQSHSQLPIKGHGHGGPTATNNHISPDNNGPHQASIPHNRAPLITPGWGEMSSVPSKPENTWGEPTLPAATVDNGTSAWGKPPGSCGSWGDSDAEGFGRGNGNPGSAPCKSAPKSMQDGWVSGEDMNLSAGQWEQDEGDMWNSTASQESNSSCSSWGNPPKKGPQKAKVPNKQDDAWIMNRLIKQLTDMGFPRDPAEEALKSNNMNLDQAMSALLERKTELDKRGMGVSDYNNSLVNKSIGCRPSVISKEPSDRALFLDKDGGLAEDVQTSPFMPSPSLKLPLASSAIPSQGLGIAMQNLNSRQMQSGMFVGSGAAQTRTAHQTPPQPTVPPVNSSQPSLRTQVPQFLSPQVQTQLLQFAAKNIGLNPALLTSPVNPQHMTLLNQLYHLQLAYQRLQIQQQMLQAQRNISGPIRQQEQQVARTINNMQQQIQQHQRQLAQALLMKQQPQPSSHLGPHPNGGKSALDSYPGHPQATGLSDLQTKEPPAAPCSFSTYPLSGLNPNMNVNCVEVSGLSVKDSPQPQSRLAQWTHPNSMENLSGISSPIEPNLSKHGPSLGSTGKPTLDESYSPYNLIPSSESPGSPLVGPDSWGQGKTTSDKMSNGTSVSWPPEFCPGVPWKGLQNIDPETDPNVTPGSVPSGPTINTNIQDVNRYLLRDRSGGKLSDLKSTWSPGPISHTQASLSHELWKGSRNTTALTRPPPGLTNTKPSSTWGGPSLGLVPGWTNSYSSGTTWSTDSPSRTSSWLVLRNLTPQIDGSTLRTLCMQHGPLITFHLNLTQGNAVVRYSSKEEAAKAQKSLHMCVLGNTTILAEFAGEEEVNRFFAQGQTLTPTANWQANPGTGQTRLAGTGTASSHPISHWNSGSLGGGGGAGAGGVGGGGGGKAGSELLWGGVQQYSSLWGPPSAEDARVIASPTPANTLLPGDLLSGEAM
ncbi:trinucleotide repeat-containing gene 6C protein [Chanos chanos]|uniref:Trinucleotide repeat-containing gene 6C protein n=1 Tax=Chanos chanos TaxID=29144 RepID=A0A6J2W418_CHACN|nr:trinucleotide repeat-containing gene 6C protein-like [Chanos chanos]